MQVAGALKQHGSVREDVGRRGKCGEVSGTHTNLLSLPCSLFSRTFSHFLNRKRLRRGEALGVEQRDQEEGASSSLDGVISMEGSWRYSLEPERDWAVTWPSVRRPLSMSLSLGTFLMRRILKRLRRRVGVEELDRTEPSDTALLPQSEYAGASFGTLTWSEGGLRVSLMMPTSSLKCKYVPQSTSFLRSWLHKLKILQFWRAISYRKVKD